MSEQLRLTGFDFTEADLREAFESSRSNVRHVLTFEQAMNNEAVRKCLAVELQLRIERQRHAGMKRGRYGNCTRSRSH
jgi:hypothetical protein